MMCKMTDCVTTSATLGFNSHFSDEPWLPGTRFSSSICSERQPLGIHSSGFITDPSCYPASSVKQWR